MKVQETATCGKMDFVLGTIGVAETVLFSHGSSRSLSLSQFALTESTVIENLDRKDWLLGKILLFGSVIASISNLEDLWPGPVANTLFGGLVLLVREFSKSDTKILTNQSVLKLRPQVIANCGRAEYYLEVYYAARVISGQIRLQEFPYYENYELLMAFETKCLQAYVGTSKFRQIQKVAFIGSGPLPLSSIEILRHLPNGSKVVNFDLCKQAISFGKSIVSSANLSSEISFQHASALEIENLHEMDVVYLAALAGGNNFEKRQITEHLHSIMKPGAVLLARSATGLRSFIYEKLSASDFGNFTNFRHFDPSNKVIINSIAMGTKGEF